MVERSEKKSQTLWKVQDRNIWDTLRQWKKNLWENACVSCLPRSLCKIEKSFSPILTDYFIQEVRNIVESGVKQHQANNQSDQMQYCNRDI
jgi:hypothetical protein